MSRGTDARIQTWGFGLLVACLALVFYLASRSDPPSDEWTRPSALSVSTTSVTRSTPSPTPVPVGPFYLVGAVRSPGIYQVRADTYLYEVIERAGGLTDRADAERLNLAETVRIGQMLRVPEIGDDPAPPLQTLAGPGTDSTDAPPRLALNTATQADLETLPGIGPATARAILTLRDARGAFQRLDELMEVPGIKERRYAQLAPYLILNEGDPYEPLPPSTE